MEKKVKHLHIPKPGGTSAECDGSQGVMMNDQVAAVNGRLLRPLLLAVEATLATSSQSVGSATRESVFGLIHKTDIKLRVETLCATVRASPPASPVALEGVTKWQGTAPNS